MAGATHPLPPKPRSRLQRLLAELPLAIGISVLLAGFISLVAGRFLENLLVSVLIGIVAFAIVFGGRLLLLDRPVWRLRDWAALALMAVLAAPVAHFTGLHTAALVLGIRAPTLADYPSIERISMVVFTFLGTTLMVVLIINRERVRRSVDEQARADLRAQIVERQAVEAQLRLLQAQIEPHMLFNTLANLQGLIALDPVRASDMLDQLIQYLRATLNVSRSQTTLLEHEFGAMGAYLGLMQVRMGERLRFRLDLPDDLRRARLPTMLLQPLVENAIVHGVEPKVDGGEITISATISATIDGDSLVIAVADTGLGLGQVHAPRGGGVGVTTSRERLAALYGDRAAITLNPANPQGTLARLTLPLEFEPCPAP